MINDNNFPDINLAIEGATCVQEICTNYINMLNSTGQIANAVYANKLQEYLDIDEKIPMFEDEFHELKKFLRQWEAINRTHIFIKTRKKSFIGFNEKIRSHFPNPDQIHDLIGFRLILITDKTDTIESVKLCYKLLNDLIEFFVINKKYEFLVASKLNNTINNEVSMPANIIMPKTNLILEGFENKVKDYIKNPKDKNNNYYQSLHASIKTPSGLIFEIQIRSFSMDLRSDHCAYKSATQKIIDLDYSNITLPGIAFDENNKLILDNSGLLKGADIFNNI